MLKTRYILFTLMILSAITATAQRTYREHIRHGNKIYTDSIYDKAETEYRKAIEKNPDNADAHFNLGNALIFQNKPQEAVKEYELASHYEKDKRRLAEIYHNTGVVMHVGKDYESAVKAYKESLRNNPDDHETRYNLALAMRELKKQQQNQEQQQDNKEEQQEQEQQNQQEQEQQNKQEQNQQEQDQKQQNQEEQEEEQKMSEENARQLLESAMQDEKEVQEKVKKMIRLRGRKLEKDW